MDGVTSGPIDRTPGTPGSDKNAQIAGGPKLDCPGAAMVGPQQTLPFSLYLTLFRF